MAKKYITRRSKKQRGGLELNEKLNSPTAEERRGMALLRANEIRKFSNNVARRIVTRRNKTRAVGSRILPRGQKLRYNTRE